MIAVAGFAAISAVACSPTDREVTKLGVGGAAFGAVGGALLGNGGRSALAGAAVGIVASGLVENIRTKNGVRNCQYRDRNGRLFEAR